MYVLSYTTLDPVRVGNRSKGATIGNNGKHIEKLTSQEITTFLKVGCYSCS